MYLFVLLTYSWSNSTSNTKPQVDTYLTVLLQLYFLHYWWVVQHTAVICTIIKMVWLCIFDWLKGNKYIVFLFFRDKPETLFIGRKIYFGLICQIQFSIYASIENLFLGEKKSFFFFSTHVLLKTWFFLVIFCELAALFRTILVKTGLFSEGNDICFAHDMHGGIRS